MPILAVGCVSGGITADPVYFPPLPASPRVVHLKSFNRLSELVPVRVSLADMLRGKIVSPFVGTPAGIAYWDNHLYICDSELNVVHDWDLATSSARRIGSSGEGVLGKPVAVAVDEGGTVFVADTARGEVVAFEAGGTEVKRYRPAARESYRPVSVAVRSGRLYAADINAHKIDVYSISNGEHVDNFGGVGSKPGRFYFPMGVATETGGHVVVSDTMNARVQVFDRQHRPVRSLGKPGNRYGDMGKPRHLAVGPDGVIFVADVDFGHVHLFNTTGQLLMMLGGPNDQPGGTPMPVGIAVAESLPDRVASLVPDDFDASYYLFVTNTIGTKRIALFAVGL